MVRNHALVDGNKRAGWAFAVITLWLNGCDITYDEDEAFAAVMKIAAGGARLSTIYEWVADMAVAAQLGEG